MTGTTDKPTSDSNATPTLYTQIDRMRQRPAMWLGEATLTALWRFTDAYQFALTQHGINEHLDPPLQEFHDFCARYFQSASEAGWCRIILADNYSQEEQALRQFFPLFDEFRARVDVMKGRRIVTAFAREMTFNQSKWRTELSDFDAVLVMCREPLCAAFRARVAHEYDAVLGDLEHIAEQSDHVRRILDDAKLAAVMPQQGVR
jgi:hypothetical protein